jgi:hypothetical protein
MKDGDGALRYVRSYASDDSESHLETGEIVMQRDASGIGESRRLPLLSAQFRKFTGSGTDWQLAPEAHIAIVLAGELRLHASDGSTEQVGPGVVLLREGTTGKGERIEATQDRIVLVFPFRAGDADAILRPSRARKATG